MNPALLLPLLVVGAGAATPSPQVKSVPTPSPAAPSAADILRRDTARATLALAVAEIDTCCQGQLEKAGFEAQRRVATSLYRWLLLSRCEPDWKALDAVLPRLADILGRLSPEYVIAVAVEPLAWLEANAASLAPPASGERLSPERFAEALCVLGVFEQDLLRARDRHRDAVVAADRVLEERRRQVEEGRAWARKALAEVRRAGKPLDFAGTFAAQREFLSTGIQEREKKIRAIQEEFWTYQREFTDKARSAVPGTIPAQLALGEYKKTADAADAKIQVLTKELVELTEQRERLQHGMRPDDLEQIEIPSAARPVAAAAATAAEGAKAAASPSPAER